MRETIGRIVAASTWAPSGDNTQPVRFAVDLRARTIGLVLDPSRDPSPMNAGQRMARIAAGAALENLIRAAEARGLVAELVLPPPGTLAVVRLGGDPIEPDRPAPELLARVTNRRAYDGRPVAGDSLGRLAGSSPPVDGVTTHWIVDQGRLGALAGLIGRADGLMFGEPSMRRAFLAKVRFDEPPEAPVDEGLSLGSLEATAPERLALRAIRRMPDRLFRIGGVSRIFAGKTRRMVRSASGLCLVVAPDGSEATDLIVGRAMQRAWLALTAEGMVAQPMMSLAVLENVAERGDPALLRALGPARLGTLRDEFRALVPEIAGRRPAWLMRFGHAPPPTGRSGRLPVEAVLLAPGLP
jgi:hypothetical protein